MAIYFIYEVNHTIWSTVLSLFYSPPLKAPLSVMIVCFNLVKSSHCLLLSKYSGKDIADSAISRIAYDNYNSRPQSTAVENINVLVWRFRWVWFLLSHKSEQKYFVFSFYALNKQIEQWCGTKNLGLLCLFKWMLEMVCYWPLWNLIVSNYQ